MAIVAYGLGMALSLLWGLSYDLFYDHGLQAEVRVGATGEGSTFVSVRNGSDVEWRNVKVEADGTWFVRFESVPPGEQRDARLREFENAYRLPRPERVFFWEQVAGQPEPFHAPAGLRPSVVRVSSDIGEFETRVEF